MKTCPPIQVHTARFPEVVRWCRIEAGVQGHQWTVRPARSHILYTQRCDAWEFSFRDEGTATLFWLQWYGVADQPPDPNSI